MVDRDRAADLFDRVLDVWRGGAPRRIRDLVTDDYQGHMLHLADGERSADSYAEWIARYQRNNPGCTFEVRSQAVVGDRLWTRLDARLPDGRVAHGMNTSTIRDGLFAEEWAIWSGWFEADPAGPCDHQPFCSG